MRNPIYKISISFIVLIILSFIIIQGLIFINGNEKSEIEVDYLIILGARLYGEIPAPALLERLKISRDYLIENKDIKVIVSGGQGIDELIPEAHAMKKYLVDNGIEPDRIVVEDKSTSTYENLLYSLEILEEIDGRENLKILIATNKHHIFRAKLIARRLGVEPYGLPAEIPPSILVKSYIREYFAVIKSFIFDR